MKENGKKKKEEIALVHNNSRFAQVIMVDAKMDELIQEAANLKASNLVLKKAILDERHKFEKACNIQVAQKETFKREFLKSLEPVHVKKDFDLILQDYHVEFLSYYSIDENHINMIEKLKFQIQILENSTLNSEIIKVLHAIIQNLDAKSHQFVFEFLLTSLRICWIKKILAEKGNGSHPLIKSLSFVLFTLNDLGRFTQKGSVRAQTGDLVAEAKNAQKLHDLSVAVQRLDAELLEIKNGSDLRVT